MSEKTILDCLSRIEKTQEQRDGFYKKELANFSDKLTEINTTLCKLDKAQSLTDEKIKNLEKSLTKDIVNTRLFGGLMGCIIILVCGILVSYYAKLPPQNINPLNAAKQIGKAASGL